MQFMGENTPTFSALGWHYRGWAITKVCDSCKDILEGRSISDWNHIVMIVRYGTVDIVTCPDCNRPVCVCPGSPAWEREYERVCGLPVGYLDIGDSNERTDNLR